MNPSIDQERKDLHEEMARMYKFYEGTTDNDDLFIRLLAAHNKQLNLLLTGARRRVQAQFQGMSIEEAMHCELSRSVGTAQGMIHVMVWFATAANDEEHQLRRLYVWAYLRRYKLVPQGLGVLSNFSLRLSHQPLEESQRQWDEAVEFYTWCEDEATRYRAKEEAEALPGEQREKKRFVGRMRELHLIKPKLSKLFKHQEQQQAH
ncbi:uncharacterized protein A1O5_13073 [Cladophialophora psammophila CBS 110553]|uniref:Uncharacterized protein n=1 Tax=Cladophialophora psammophila CBS 110553 TaxID=1182543 RepID=W9VDM6_9EURO|nr:uncharacterized protein A1O5_13073 [Cladophialophora psammophila CBS 110553]EXJ53717.1 hypothetical protein A1O5_13073 [Cladophialophora psammophila CBS 110553]